MHDISDDGTRPSPLTPIINPEEPSLKRVRITLPPSPPPDLQMSQLHFANSNQPRRTQRSSVSLSQSGGRVVFPADKIQDDEEKHRLRSGSKWRQYDLALLRVKFEPNEDSDLTMLDVEREWSPSQRQRILPISPRLLIAYRSRFIS